MPRRNVAFKKGGLYHVSNHASHKTNIFELDEDCNFFVALAKALAVKSDVIVVAFALADSEYHLLVRQKGKTTISNYMKDLGSKFSRYYNRRHQQDGSIYKNRFAAAEVKSQGYLYSVTRRMYQQVARLRKCSHPSKWKYCNYREIIGEVHSSPSVQREIADTYTSRSAFRRYVDENLRFHELGLKDLPTTCVRRHSRAKNKEPPT